MHYLAECILLHYLQDWGQTVATRIEWLNRAASSAGIAATFSQGPNGENAGWCGDTELDVRRAKAFRNELDLSWRGRFEAEIVAIKSLIAKYKSRKDDICLTTTAASTS